MKGTGSDTRRTRILRHIAPTVAGVLTIIVLSTATDAVMHGSGVFPPEGESMPAPLWVLAITYRVIYQVAGGYVTAWLTPDRSSMTPVMVLAGLGVVLSLAGVAATWNAGPQFGPRWYSVLLVILAAPTVWLGGRLGTGRLRSRVR